MQKTLATLQNKWQTLLALTLAVVLVFSAIFYRTQAAGLPFGGMVTVSIPCTCSTGMFLLTIGPPRGGQFVYQVGTQAYSNFNLPRVGVWTLGLYVPGGVCMIYAGKSCVATGLPLGTITSVVGTSL